MQKMLLANVIKTQVFLTDKKKSYSKWLRDERGVVSIEYALVIALVVGAVSAAFAVMNPKISEFFGNVMDKVLAMI
jgi:Flp pilus assembly pilin Flp